MKAIKRGQVGSILSYLCVGVCALLCCGWAIVELSGGRLGFFFWMDLLGAVVFQSALLSLLVGFVLWILGRKRLAFLCVLIACIGAWPIVAGRALVTRDSKIGDQRLLIGSLNMFPRNESWQTDLETMVRLGLDVLVVQELPIDMNRGIRAEGYMDESEMPYWVHRAWVDQEVSPGFILARYPLEKIPADPDDPFGKHQLMCIVHHPEGDFVVGLVHPVSPRSKSRWELGNQVVRARKAQFDQVLHDTGLEMIVGADLNGGRAQFRGRELRRSGLEPSKPLLNSDGGSFPTGLPGVLQIQIDDLWISKGVSVESWEMMTLSGSDHRAVIATLVIKRAAD